MAIRIAAGFLWFVVGCNPLLAQQPQHIAIKVRETAGIRRFGYPVTAQLSLPQGALRKSENARLVSADGKALPAQFTTMSRHPDGSIARLELDFNLSPGPLETAELKLEYGQGVTALEAKAGLTFAETDEAYRVSAYTIRKDGKPLISSVKYGREYLQPGGLGVVAWIGLEERPLEVEKQNWTIEKRGPFKVQLRCDGTYLGHAGGADKLPFTLTLEFVSTKSWVGLRHSVKSATAKDRVSLGIVGEFQMEGRLLWDTDVDYWLYGVLEAGEQMTFSQQEDSWLCRLGKGTQPTSYAANTLPHRRAKGWGHFQESRENGNVVAFGFGGPASKGNYWYSADGDGTLRMRCSPTDAEHSDLTGFFHFIPVPAQHTARTSPAAMMLPLEVTSNN
jgi:hypothetical protein